MHYKRNDMISRILILSAVLFASSCNFENEDPDMVHFVFSNEDKTVFEEVKVIAFSEKDGTLVPVDSINHYPLKSPSIPYYSSIGIGFFIEDIESYSDGTFEAVAIKKDSTVFRTQIGVIQGKSTKRNFAISMSNAGIQLK